MEFPDFLKEAFDSLVRGNRNDLRAYLKEVQINIPLLETQAEVHCHALAFDAQKMPRVKDLALFLANKILDYSIPRSEVEKAISFQKETGSTSKILELQKKAENLFTEIQNSGEGGELLLYLLVEYFLGLPQVMCKMPLKTNSNVHYHGIDGIHASVDEVTKTLGLYWGESKLYENIDNAIKACIKDLSPFLIPDGGSKDPRARDLQLMRDNLGGLNENNLQEALIKYLDPDDPKYNQLEYRGVCLIGFDIKSYPNAPHQKTEEEVCEEIKKSIESWLLKLKGRIKKEKIERFVLQVFLIPFPSVQEFRDAFAKEIGVDHLSRAAS